MAQSPHADLFMTLLAKATASAEILRLKNPFPERIYWEYQPIVASAYETLTITVPTVNEGNVVDTGLGPIQPTDFSYTQASIKLNLNLHDSLIIKAWDQVKTPIMLRDKWIPARVEEMNRRINRLIVGLVNATNFPNYTLFTGTGTVAGQLTRADIAQGLTQLAGVGVPTEDFGNVSLMENHITWFQHLADTQFTQVLNVGEPAGVAAQQRAVLAPMLGAVPYYDQMLKPFNAGHQPAMLMHRYAIGGVSVEPPSLGIPGVMESTFDLYTDVPCRLSMAGSFVDQGWIIDLNAMIGIAVIRPEMAILFQTAS